MNGRVVGGAAGTGTGARGRQGLHQPHHGLTHPGRRPAEHLFHPFEGAEQIAGQPVGRALDVLEQERRSLGRHHPVLDDRDLLVRIDRRPDSNQIPLRLKAGQKLPEIGKAHRTSSQFRPVRRPSSPRIRST